MPSQLVNDSRIVPIAGNHTNTTWMGSGCRPSATAGPCPIATAGECLRRRLESRARRRVGSAEPVAASCPTSAAPPHPRVGELCDPRRRSGSSRPGSGRRRSRRGVTHHVGREVGAGVAVEELGDVRRGPDQLGRLRPGGVVPRRVGVAVAATLPGFVVRKHRSPPACRGRRALPWRPPRCRVGGHHEAVDRRIDGVGADGRRSAPGR